MYAALVGQAKRGDQEAFDSLAGTLGDVTVLSGDVLNATPDEIRAMAVVATIVGGVPAHCADRRLCTAEEDRTK